MKVRLPSRVSLLGQLERLAELTVESWGMIRNLSRHKSLGKAFQHT